MSEDDSQGQTAPLGAPIDEPIAEPIGEPIAELTAGLGSAGQQVLNYLQRQFPMGLWTITRVAGESWILLQVSDRGYRAKSQSVLRWSDSFCSRMVRGEGPCFAPDVRMVASYLAAPIGRDLEIGAYVGVPLKLPDGEFFGTLCGIDRTPRDAFAQGLEDTVKLVAELLSLVIAYERSALASQRRLSSALRQAQTDALTGVANRRGWQERLAMEEARLTVLGDKAGVIVIDLDDLKLLNDRDGHAAGDELLRRAAATLRACVRSGDYVARVGGDEFMVLAVDCDRPCLDRTLERLSEALEQAGVAASIGSAVRLPGRPMIDAQTLADERMYQSKRQRKSDD